VVISYIVNVYAVKQFKLVLYREMTIEHSSVNVYPVYRLYNGFKHTRYSGLNSTVLCAMILI